jgi:hypothetical protein
MSRQGEEGMMKCPKCNGSLFDSVDRPGMMCCPSCAEYIKKKPKNPSPQDIFKHIESPCEKYGFDEFMKTLPLGLHYTGILPDIHLLWIKDNHPDWFSFLQSKGLVAKKVVRRERRMSGVVGEPSKTFPSTLNVPNGAKWEIIYSWEEEEQ